MTGKNTKKTRRKYDAAFKEEVLKMVASGRPVPEIAQALGVGDNLIYRWKNAAKSEKGKASNLHNGSTQTPDAFLEIERLKSEFEPNPAS